MLAASPAAGNRPRTGAGPYREGRRTMTEREELRRKGETVRAALFAGQTPAGDTEAIPGFRDLLAEVNYAGVWSRPGLGRTDRMVCTLSAQVGRASGRERVGQDV